MVMSVKQKKIRNVFTSLLCLCYFRKNGSGFLWDAKTVEAETGSRMSAPPAGNEKCFLHNKTLNLLRSFACFCADDHFISSQTSTIFREKSSLLFEGKNWAAVCKHDQFVLVLFLFLQENLSLNRMWSNIIIDEGSVIFEERWFFNERNKQNFVFCEDWLYCDVSGESESAGDVHVFEAPNPVFSVKLLFLKFLLFHSFPPHFPFILSVIYHTNPHVFCRSSGPLLPSIRTSTLQMNQIVKTLQKPAWRY